MFFTLKWFLQRKKVICSNTKPNTIIFYKILSNSFKRNHQMIQYFFKQKKNMSSHYNVTLNWGKLYFYTWDMDYVDGSRKIFKRFAWGEHGGRRRRSGSMRAISMW